MGRGLDRGDAGAVAQERTLDAARVSLREALKDILAANRELALVGPTPSD